MTFKLHHAHLRSCMNLRASFWLFACLVIPPFCLPFVFLLCVAHQVGSLPFVSFWGDPLHLWSALRSYRGPPSLLFPWWGMDCITWCNSRCLCLLLWEMQGLVFHMSKPMFFHPLPFNLFISGLTLCYQLMAFAPWRMLSCCWFHLNRFGFLGWFIS
jgi:hypothetical protein